MACGVRAGKRLVRHGLHLLDHLIQTVVAAGLEDRGGHGDGPDARREQLVAVEIRPRRRRRRCASCPRTGAEMRWHISMVSGNRLRPDMYISLVGQLAPRWCPRGRCWRASGRTPGPLPSASACSRSEHGHRVGPLQILVEVVLVKHDVVVAHAVQRAAAPSRSPGCVGLHLTKVCRCLLGDEVAGDALDLLRRTAVERGHGDAAADARDRCASMIGRSPRGTAPSGRPCTRRTMAVLDGVLHAARYRCRPFRP